MKDRNSLQRAMPFRAAWRHLGVVALALPAVFGSVAATAGTNLDFDVQNRTTQAIVSMWTAPAYSGNWLAVRNVYLPGYGGTTRVYFDAGTEVTHTCNMDLQVRFAGGEERFWRNLNLCTTRGMWIDAPNGEVTGTTY